MKILSFFQRLRLARRTRQDARHESQGHSVAATTGRDSCDLSERYIRQI